LFVPNPGCRLGRTDLGLVRSALGIREVSSTKLILYQFNVQLNFYIKYLSNIRQFVEFFSRDLSINAF
jgi:hypothetical protein